FTPLLTTGVDATGTEVALAHRWCMGFVEGMQMHEAHWFGRADDELQRLLHPIRLMFADMLLILSKSPPKRVKRLSLEEMNRFADAIPDAVIALRSYWRQHPVADEPASVRGVPKVGRNDPCPCGSGNKFKHCCGASAGVRAPEPGRGAAPPPTAQHVRGPREKGTWIAGLAEFPGFVDGEGPPYRPVAALVLDGEGLILAASLQRPEKRQEAVTDAVRQALGAPTTGEVQRPDRVVVPAAELVPLMKRALPGVKIAVGPTPELDAALASLRDRTSAPGDEHRTESYLTADTTPDALSAFFDAAAELYEHAPWTVVPDDASLFRITSSKLDLRGGVACVIGQAEESYGVILFDSPGDCEEYRRLARLAMSEDMPSRGLPRHAALSFERAQDLAPALRREIGARKWRVAGPAAFPRIMLVEPDMILRPPTHADYRRMEGVCRAISRLIDTEAGLSRAWEGARSLRRRLTVEVEGMPVSVTISLR
ncbi:MAG TPA: UPF0149 family protein, partial [Candidatus Krumholzibacteria bacterium]|nr:UPF0149 family protein [Candidatus Krumholzibacteria bacterium]